MSFLKTILDLLFPENCLGCGRPETVLCQDCAAELPRGLSPEGALAILDYQDRRVKRAIWLFKYRNKRALAKILAEVVYAALLEELAELRLMKNFREPLLVPMPISRRRFRERGYNQVLLLARELALLGGEFALTPDALRKTRHTESQVETASRRERLKNLRGSFSADPAAVRGRNIILLDDVITTGATLSEARRALREAGAKKILCVAVAH